MPIHYTARHRARGSRLRRLKFTDGAKADVARRITEIVSPHATVGPDDFYMPRGIAEPQEAKLGKACEFLSDKDRERVTSWWLANRNRANTPNWDIVSTAEIGSVKGLVLIEAKAHPNELKTDDKCCSRNPDNRDCIKGAILEANHYLNTILPGWSLSAQTHYQLSNRFAWEWKVASLGIPVVLVYLGFQNATEMKDRGSPFKTGGDWESAIKVYTKGIIRESAWENPLFVNKTTIYALIRSIRLDPTLPA